MKITAKFLGEDYSGYINNKSYDLDFNIAQWIWDEGISIMEITQVKGAITSLKKESYCEYKTLREFLDNWEIL